MAYIGTEQYIQYTGEAPPDDFDVLADMAAMAVDRVTLYRLRGRSLAELPDVVRADVERATAIQMQYLSSQGGVAAINDIGAPNMTLGKFSYSGGDADSAGGMESPLLPDLLAYVCAHLRGE